MNAPELDLLQNVRPAKTGKQLIFFSPGVSVKEMHRYAYQHAGIRVASVGDYRKTALQYNRAEGLLLDTVKVMVVNSADPQKVLALRSVAQNPRAPIAHVREEYQFYESRVDKPSFALEPFVEVNSEPTWGLRATNVAGNALTGWGVKVAVLDTGFFFPHPDFANRSFVDKSFVPTEPTALDTNGHGTHTIGTACGPRSSQAGGYGVASEAIMYVGKVLASNGAGAESFILAGINWALGEGCQVISLSLGGQSDVYYTRAYDNIGKLALRRGCLLVAAAGNESARNQGYLAPVSSPASAASILAVAALNSHLRVTDFSNAGASRSEPQVDLAAPGASVLSSWLDGRYKFEDGTSMAAPHVAGVAALLAQANPDAYAADPFGTVLRAVKKLSGARRDVGAGIIFAP